MSFTSVFKSFGHAIAAGAKYFEIGVKDAMKVAQKATVLEPEADLLLTAIAGPQAAKINDLACHVLGLVAEKLQPVGQDAVDAVAANGLNLQIDTQTVLDIKAVTALIEQLLSARGTPAPAAKA